MARGGKGERPRVNLVHRSSRRRILPGPLTPRRGMPKEGCLAVLSWRDFLLTRAGRARKVC